MHLLKCGYKKAPKTEDLFLHETRDILFILFVNDFGIKYTQKEDIDHLIVSIRKKHLFKIDWGTK